MVRRPPRGLQAWVQLPFFSVDLFPGRHTSDFKTGIPVATLPGAGISTGTVWPGVSILSLAEMESLIYTLHLSLAACTITEQIRPCDTRACCWDVKQPTNTNDSSANSCQLCFTWLWLVFHQQAPELRAARGIPTQEVWKPDCTVIAKQPSNQTCRHPAMCSNTPEQNQHQRHCRYAKRASIHGTKGKGASVVL